MLNSLQQTLASNTWLAMGVLLTAFLALYGTLQLYARATAARPETTRKMFHTGSGVLTLAFPFLFREVWPVLLLTGATALFIAAIKFLPALRQRLGQVANRVDRSTLGEIYFPVSVAFVFWMALGESPLLFVIPVLVLTFADATCAIIGGRYGMTRYVGASKSLEGSVAFLVVAFFCIHVPLLLWSGVGRAESLLIAAILALLVMVLEGSAWRGLDNLFIPVGGFFLLRAFLVMDVPALLARLLVVLGLVALIVVARRRTTLEDDSLAAGAFLCYLAWALMGWPWLLGPFAILLGYRWLSAPTAENTQRIHGVRAVLSVWAPAILWLALARMRIHPELLLPYTVVFATHLAMFGASRLAFQFPGRAIPSLFWRAVVTSWAIVMAPYIAVTGAAAVDVAAAVGSIAPMAAGTALFVSTQPDIRNADAGLRRWILQGMGAAVASLLAWGVGIAAEHLAG